MQVQELNDFDYCLKKLFDLPSSFVLIFGDWKTGKTDFALLIAERLLELRIVSEVASNIKSSDSRMQFIANLPHLKKWLRNSNTRKLYVFDEAGVHLHKRRSMSSKNVSFMTLLPEISKAHARMIAITQNPASIDAELLSPVWCKGIIIKENLYKAKFISELFSGDKKVCEFYPVPKTTIDFDPYAIAPFKLTAPVDVPADFLNDEEKKILWNWSINEMSARKLNLHPMKLNRIVRKFVREVLTSKIEGKDKA
jgi:hypothetical protein